MLYLKGTDEFNYVHFLQINMKYDASPKPNIQYQEILWVIFSIQLSDSSKN